MLQVASCKKVQIRRDLLSFLLVSGLDWSEQVLPNGDLDSDTDCCQAVHKCFLRHITFIAFLDDTYIENQNSANAMSMNTAENAAKRTRSLPTMTKIQS